MSNIRLYHLGRISENTTSLLSKEHTHYVANVMRLKRGSNINFFNKDGEWVSEIIFLEKDRVEVKFLNKIKDSIKKSSNIELAICLVKKNPMDMILQKATELGVAKIAFPARKTIFEALMWAKEYKKSNQDNWFHRPFGDGNTGKKIASISWVE